MKYRIKINDEYLTDSNNYLALNQIHCLDIELPKNSQNTITLQWMWAFDTSDELDTQIGNRGTATYTIQVDLLYKLHKE